MSREFLYGVKNLDVRQKIVGISHRGNIPDVYIVIEDYSPHPEIFKHRVLMQYYITS